ncbi:MAG: WecB/TagA/CpsF family glycosyltransferase [Thermovirgaceae bacterium]
MAILNQSLHFLVFFALILSVTLSAVQRTAKKRLDRDQYYYLKDLLFIAAWAMTGLWLQEAGVRAVVGMSLLAAVVGMGQRAYPSRWWVGAFFAIGAVLARAGLRIEFIGMPGDSYLFFSFPLAVILTSLWIGIYPLLLQELDQVPGLAGFLLAITWVVLLFATGLSSQNLQGAFSMSLMGVFILAVFWSRHGHSYRRIGEPLAAMWGTLIAGTSILGVSKEIAFSTMMILPLGLFAIPIAETSLHVMSSAFSVKPKGTLSLYRNLVSRGIDHTSAVRAVGTLCAVVGVSVASVQMREEPLVLFGGFVVASGLLVYTVMTLLKRSVPAIPVRRPGLWGVSIDNVSADYVLSKILAWTRDSSRGRYIVTLDALSTLRAKRDESFRECVRGADLILPDGKGLTIALRFLGKPVQQRIAGVELVEKMCRLASYERLSVYFYGGKSGVAAEAAERMAARYPGLRVAGTAHGYQDEKGREHVLEDIKSSGARFVFVALGVPKQEDWMVENAPQLAGSVCIGVGGSFDVLSGRLKRAPQGWQKTGCEWLYRLVQEPWRWRRVTGLPVFVFWVLLTKIGLYRNRGMP